MPLLELLARRVAGWRDRHYPDPEHGTYRRVSPPDGQPHFNSQDWFIAHGGGVG